MVSNPPTPRPHLAPLRDGNDPKHEWFLLAERRRLLHIELAETEATMDWMMAEMLAAVPAKPQPRVSPEHHRAASEPAVAGWELRRRREEQT